MSIEAMKQAIDALQCTRHGHCDHLMADQAIEALRTAIQQAEAKTGGPVGYENEMGELIKFPQPCIWMGADCPRKKAIANTPDCYEMLYTHPAPGVPDWYAPVPLQVLRDASEALGNFVSDHGWGDSDMQAMDNLDAYIAQHTATQAQKGQP